MYVNFQEENVSLEDFYEDWIRMRRFIGVLFMLVLTAGSARGQFSAAGGSGNDPFAYIPPSNSGLEKVFVFNGSQQASLSFTADNPSDWTWYRYTQDPDAAVPVDPADVVTGASRTTVRNLQFEAGYFVKSTTGEVRFAYAVLWKPLAYISIDVVDEGDACSDLTLRATVSPGNDMTFYTAVGLKRTVERVHTLHWSTLEWNSLTGAYAVVSKEAPFKSLGANWAIPAPLLDTPIKVVGDEINHWFGVDDSASVAYVARAVKANATATVELRQHANESGASTGELAGSAPLTVNFSSNPSQAVTLVEWNIYKPGNTGAYARFTGEDLHYTFKESGNYTVKVFVSNTYCRDSAVFSSMIYESMLDCPNFFTPRSSPGENDEFRVVYKSILTFKGVIVDRWGVVVFEWTDPGKGWDGTYKGKAVKPGVYFYSIEAKGSDGRVYHKKGDINLLE